MRKTLLFLSAATCLLVACEREKEGASGGEDQVPVNLYGIIGPETRANSEGFQTGDRLGIYVVNYENSTPGTLQAKGNQVTNVAFTKAATWVPDYDVYYKDKTTPVDFYGYYPYIANLEQVTDIPFEVKEDQSQDGSEGVMGAYEASDFMWAFRENVSPSASAVVLSFKHRMSQVTVSLVKGTGFGDTWDGLSKEVLVSNVKRHALIDLSTGTVTATGDVSARHTVPYYSNGAFRAIVVPQAMAAATTLFTITIDGTPYEFKDASPFTYLQGKQHNFEITVNKKADGTYEFVSTSTIQPWDNDSRTLYLTSKSYVVVNLTGTSTAEYSELNEKLAEKGIVWQELKNLKLTGTMSVYDVSTIADSKIEALNLSEIQGINYPELSEYHYWGRPDYSNTDYYIYLENLSSLRTILFPNNATTLDGSLKGTSVSGAIHLPDALRVMRLMFYGTSITSINLPSSLIEIGSQAFYECSLLTMKLILPKSLKTIGPNAFRGCTGITGPLVLPDDLETIGMSAFSGCTGLTGRLVVPSKTTVIPHTCFWNCSGLTGLTLHDGITTIEQSAFAACYSMQGELSLPKSLINLQQQAFSSTSFSGQLVIPEGLASIPSQCFQYPRSGGFTEIILPEDFSGIGSQAFEGHNNLTSIKSYSQYPPTISVNAFPNVIADVVSVEVPNQKAVSDYYSASGWSSFSNIHANMNFEVDKERIEALNAAFTTQISLEAGPLAAWSVALSEGASEWITVAPESGTGPATLTVNLAALPVGDENRTATITYVLIGEDYTVKTEVGQFNYAPQEVDNDDNPLYLDDVSGAVGESEVIHVMTHNQGIGIPVVFLGDGFNAAEVASGTYLRLMKHAIRYFFDIEPFYAYRNFFDVYIIVGVSPERGLGSPHSAAHTRYGTSYGANYQIVPQPEMIFTDPAVVSLGLDLTKTTFVVVTNCIDEDGTTVIYDDGRTVSYCPLSYTDVYPFDFGGHIQFEACGRGFGRLGDERVLYSDSVSQHELNGLHKGQIKNWFQNLSDSGSMDKVPWGHFFQDPDYQEIVDMYEGAMGYAEGIFRSEANSCMSNKIAYFNTVSREAIAKRIYELSGVPYSYQAFKNKDKKNPHNETRGNGKLK